MRASRLPRAPPAAPLAGNGKTSGGRPSVTPWGWPTKGGWKTRTSSKYSDRLIVTRRPPGVRMKSRK